MAPLTLEDRARPPLVKVLRFSRSLEAPRPPAAWPPGFAPAAFAPDTDAKAIHRLLVEGYAGGGGSVADFESWWAALSSDPEYDPELVFTAHDRSGRLAGAAICWTSGYVKDLVVSPSHRRRGLASSLLAHAFATFQARGAGAVDLKVEAGNSGAISLYRSLGMEEIATGELKHPEEQ
jgi:ribosomal protein S18 acetylase RimI-like enzyme